MSTSTCTSYDAFMIINSDWAVLRITSGGAKITVSNNPPSTTITDNFSTIRWRNKSFNINEVDIQFKITVDSDQTQITVETCHGDDGFSRGDAGGRVIFYIGDTECENNIVDETETNAKEHTISLCDVVGTPDQLDILQWHHPSLWFKDGSIVIRAQETLFKVHQSLLALHSPIFASTFSIPQPCDQEIIEGCPVVDIPDNADDVTCLLKVIYEPTYFALQKPTEVLLPFEDLASILRLSNKYDIPSFRSRCIDEFKSIFPCTLEKFDAFGYNSEFYHRNAPKSPRRYRFLPSALLLFRECDLPAFLPSLFYFLTRGSLAETLSRLSDLPKSEILGCILLGREKLLDAQFAYPPNFNPSSGCVRPERCRESGLRRREALINARRLTNQCALANVAYWFNNDAPFFCSSCTNSYKDAYKSARKKVWNELPGYFGLGTWEEIRESIE